MSKANVIKTPIMVLAIIASVAGILYARVNLGVSEQALGAWLESATGTIALASAVIWVAVVWLFIQRRALG